jgi:ubiquitin C-terminal hydrolase
MEINNHKQIIKNKNGLMSFGYNCFINTGIQCLRHCPSIISIFNDESTDSKLLEKALHFNQNLQDQENEDFTDLTDIDDSQNDDSQNDDKINSSKMNIKNLDLCRIYFSFKKLLIDLTNNNQVANPNNFIMACNQKVRNDNSMYNHLFNGSQNDVSEFIVFLLDIIRDVKSNKTKMTIQHQEIKTFNQKVKIDSMKNFIKIFEEDYSWIIQDFYYMMVTTTKCSNCDYMSITHDPSNNLHAEIPSCEHINLYDCIDHHLGQEKIHDWTCEKCKNKNGNLKENRLIDGPEILIIPFKRFKPNRHKNNKLITFPLLLNLSPYILGSDNTANYKLFAVANHIGSSIHSGHYTAYCRDVDSDNWFCYNDSSVSHILESQIVSNKAYLLFYKKIT